MKRPGLAITVVKVAGLEHKVGWMFLLIREDTFTPALYLHHRIVSLLLRTNATDANDLV